MFKLTRTGNAAHTHILYDLELANYSFESTVRNGYWEKVTLSMWVEGIGEWHTMRTHVKDWHSSALTHSYV